MNSSDTSKLESEVTTGKMVAAKFEHDSARPVNGYAAPQLHTHVVIFNVAQTADGETHALQPHELYKSQQYATAIYRAELASRLNALGYELETAKNGAFKLRATRLNTFRPAAPATSKSRSISKPMVSPVQKRLKSALTGHTKARST